VSRGAPANLGPYRLLNVVHTGHACQLWQAYDDGRQRMVAIKTLLEKFYRDREQLGFLRWEYNVGQKIRDPRIVEMLFFGWDRDQPYLALEWFAAPNMKQHILQGVDKIAPIVPKIIEQAAEALAYFNRAGWVHRDVKPDNFLVTDTGEVKLIDFALAHPCRRGILKWLTPRAKVQGTKSYMSPEQIRGRALDQRADLYSFACTIWELVCGKPLFTGVNSNDLLMKHLRASIPSPEAYNPRVTPEFSRLLRSCLAKKPDARPKSVDEFLKEFRTIKVFKPTATGIF
jgi:eukaryotic-like serine/threonine-protein kinase